jgi:hypothetical protein
MPEASVDEDSELLAGEDDIRANSDFAGVNPGVLAEAMPLTMET